MINAQMIDKKDNVAVAIEKIEKGAEIVYKNELDVVKIIAAEDIEIYHKFAVRKIEKDEPIVKYGEHIGIANQEIEIGQHVHVHNVESHREEL